MLLKYPRTPHLEGSRRQPGDEDLDSVPFAEIRGRHLVVDCEGKPRAFPSGHARFQYFRTPGRDPNYAAYDDTRVEVTVLSGLPGVGKDHWIRINRAGWSVVSLDGIRQRLGIDPAGDQRPVAAQAFEEARGHLSAQRPFVWNAP